jgi:hypothetical protein
MDDLRDFQKPDAKNRQQLRVADGARLGFLDAIKMASRPSCWAPPRRTAPSPRA